MLPVAPSSQGASTEVGPIRPILLRTSSKGFEMADILGIDIGGSGIKGARVDVQAGAMTSERVRVDTPQPATPDQVAQTVRSVCDAFPDLDGPIGCTFPAIVRAGHVASAANVDPSWIGIDASDLLSSTCGRDVHVVNDADAAGLAEVRGGAAQGRQGVVLILTLGTGIGSALFNDGVLVPNTELGHLEFDGVLAEVKVSSRARKERGQSFEEWSQDLNRYLCHVERLFSPDLIVIGGGVSKKFDKFGPFLSTSADLVPAKLRNDAGIVGAAMWAAG